MAIVKAPIGFLGATGKSRCRFDDLEDTIYTNDYERLCEDGTIRLAQTGNARILETEINFLYEYREQPTPRGRITIRQKYTPYVNPQGTEQQLWRGVMADAVAAWQALSFTDQVIWNKTKYPYNMSGYNRFVRNYLKTHPL